MKPIMLTQEAKDNALEIFKKLLESATDNADLKISITSETLIKQAGVEKPTIFILAAAYAKMTALIGNSSEELAWYGLATRVKNNYLIEDILVYPQTVTSVTVDADEEKCAKWFMELPDNVINNLKFQGHSHVNMGTTPSGRDTNNWQQFANLLKPDEFMILCIGNKKGEFYWNIYDKAINVLFENKDITLVIVDEKGNSITDWATESIKKYIVKETPTVTAGSYTVLGGHVYETIPENKNVKPSTTQHVKVNKHYEEMLMYIPVEYMGEIDYEPETDTYFTDIIGLKHFHYSSLYSCYVCDGPYFRTLNKKRTNAKHTVNKSKKDNKNK
jgi:hypothetical protein